MNAEGGLLLFLGLMLGVPLLLGALQLLNRLAGRTLVPLWIPILLLLAVPVAGSFFLDVAGTVHKVKVTDKHETITYGSHFHRTGSWSRNFQVTVEHPWADQTLTPQLGLGADAAIFDALQIGQIVEVRVLELGPLFKFGRLANRSTFSMLTSLFPAEPRGPWYEGTATIQQISRFTEQRTRRSASRTPLPWPYQIVRFSFTPTGRTQPIEAMDNIEIACLPDLKEGSTIAITWPADNPRAARIAHAQPGAPWANWFYVLGQDLALLAALFVIIFLFAWWRKHRRKNKQAKPVRRISTT
jgi:hypothetical protein